jgi:tetratricopeptide (TPR) repeat protein
MRISFLLLFIATARAQESPAALRASGLEMQTAGRYEEAADLFARALTAWERMPGSNSGELIATLICLGQVYAQTGRLGESEVALRRALAAGEPVYGRLSTPLILTHSQLGWVLLLSGDKWGAEAELTHAAALAREASLPIRDQAPILVNLASLRIQQGLLLEAASLLEQVPFDVAALMELARLHRLQGNTARAAPPLRRAAIMIEESYGPGHPELARVWSEEALVALAENRPVMAAALLKQALHLLPVAIGPHHVEVARLKHNLALAYIAQNRCAPAEPLLGEALAGTQGQEHAVVLSKLAHVYTCLGRKKEAASLYRQAIAEFGVAGPSDQEFARTLLDYARLIVKNDREEARRLERRAKGILGPGR